MLINEAHAGAHGGRRRRPDYHPGMSERWKPNVTVAAIVERDGRYLLVEEETSEGLRLNNPAGHLEPRESFLQAVAREVLEETARVFTPDALLGVYLGTVARNGDGEVTYLRVAFRGTVGDTLPGRALDQGIVRAVWLTAEEVRASVERHRSPLVLRCIEDHRAGRRFPMDLLVTDGSVYVTGAV